MNHQVNIFERFKFDLFWKFCGRLALRFFLQLRGKISCCGWKLCFCRYYWKKGKTETNYMFSHTLVIFLLTFEIEKFNLYTQISSCYQGKFLLFGNYRLQFDWNKNSYLFRCVPVYFQIVQIHFMSKIYFFLKNHQHIMWMCSCWSSKFLN